MVVLNVRLAMVQFGSGSAIFLVNPEPEPQSMFRFSSGSNLVHPKKNTILYQ